jgi:heme A synthase
MGTTYSLLQPTQVLHHTHTTVQPAFHLHFALEMAHDDPRSSGASGIAVALLPVIFALSAESIHRAARGSWQNTTRGSGGGETQPMRADRLASRVPGDDW